MSDAFDGAGDPEVVVCLAVLVRVFEDTPPKLVAHSRWAPGQRFSIVLSLCSRGELPSPQSRSQSMHVEDPGAAARKRNPRMPREARRRRQTRGGQQASICEEVCQGRLWSLYIVLETTSENRAAFAASERRILITIALVMKLNGSLEAREPSRWGALKR